MTATLARPTPLACARWLIVAIMVALLFSPPLTNLAELALVLCLAASGELRRRLVRAVGQPMGIATLALAALIVIGAGYSIGSAERTWSMLTGWRKLLLLPIAAALFDEPRWKTRLGLILVAVVALCAALSYVGLALGRGVYLYPPGIIVRNYATQGMMFSVAAFVAASFLRYEPSLSRALRLWLALAAALLFANVVLVTPGRSGYVVLLACTAAFVFDLLRRHRGDRRVYGLSALLVALVVGSLAASPLVRDRIGQGVREMETYRHAPQLTSMGIRMVLWQNTLKMIGKRPWFGYGTGSFEAAYRQQVAGQTGWQALDLSADPHDQYLKIAAEHGLVGLAVFFVFLLSALFQRPGAVHRLIGLGVLFSWCGTSLFSSHFSTFSEGSFIALWCGAMLANEATPEGRT